MEKDILCLCVQVYESALSITQQTEKRRSYKHITGEEHSLHQLVCVCVMHPAQLRLMGSQYEHAKLELYMLSEHWREVKTGTFQSLQTVVKDSQLELLCAD